MPTDATPPTPPANALPNRAAPRERVVVPLRLDRRPPAAGRLVHMPKGPLGFPEHHDFVLADVPDPALVQFKLLHALHRQGPVLIVTPMPADRRLIAEDDLAEIAALAGVEVDDAVFLLVVTVRRRSDGDDMAMSLNLRAPIVFDPANRRARQCVIRRPAYLVRHPFFGWHRVAAAGRDRRLGADH